METNKRYQELLEQTKQELIDHIITLEELLGFVIKEEDEDSTSLVKLLSSSVEDYKQDKVISSAYFKKQIFDRYKESKDVQD